MKKLKKILKTVLPKSLYCFCKKVYNRLTVLKYKTGKRNHICPLCEKKYSGFLPSGEKAEIFDTINIIGGGYRDNSLCPGCCSTERLRLLFIYLSRYTDIFGSVSAPAKNHTDAVNKKYKILHFAPEAALEKRLKSADNIDYISCDAEKDRAMTVVDITDISFADNTFDFIICNHVLEHISDEAKAFSEIKRVLKDKTGIAFLTVPVCPDITETLENKNILTDEERLKHYGQSDHVRLYGLDFKQRLTSAGFVVKTFNSSDDCAELIQKHFLLPNETIFVVMKKDDVVV